MSVDVSCAAATQEIFIFVTREQGECQGILEFLAGLKRMLEIGFNFL